MNGTALGGGHIKQCLSLDEPLFDDLMSPQFPLSKKELVRPPARLTKEYIDFIISDKARAKGGGRLKLSVL